MCPKGPCAQVAVSLLVLLREAKASRRWGTVRGMRGCLKGCWNPGPFSLPAAMRWAVPAVMSSYHDNLPCHSALPQVQSNGHKGPGPEPFKITREQILYLFPGLLCHSDRKLTKIERMKFSDLLLYDIQNLDFSAKKKKVKNMWKQFTQK